MSRFIIDVWQDESIWSWAGEAEDADAACEAARLELNQDWDCDYETWDDLAADMNGTALMHDTRPNPEAVRVLVDAVQELLDNRSFDYLHEADREMLKEALLPLESQ